MRDIVDKVALAIYRASIGPSAMSQDDWRRMAQAAIDTYKNSSTDTPMIGQLEADNATLSAENSRLLEMIENLQNYPAKKDDDVENSMNAKLPCWTCGHLSAEHSDIGTCEIESCRCTCFYEAMGC